MCFSFSDFLPMPSSPYETSYAVCGPECALRSDPCPPMRPTRMMPRL